MKYKCLLFVTVMVMLNISACSNSLRTGGKSETGTLDSNIKHIEALQQESNSKVLKESEKQNCETDTCGTSATGNNPHIIDLNKIGTRKQRSIQLSIFKYLSDYKNRETVKDRAISLNHGDQHNSCVYFVSEVLRRVGVDISLGVCNTGKTSNESKKNISLTYQLSKRGWNICYDLSLLQAGDICFTTVDTGGKPTHSYIFMGWVKGDSTDFAFVCDNQSYYYGTTYHKRNIKKSLDDRDAFYYFMFKPLA